MNLLVIGLVIAGLQQTAPVEPALVTPPPSRTLDDPRKDALVRRYFEATQLAQIGSRMVESMLQSASLVDMDEGERDQVILAAKEVMDALLPELMTRYAVLYAETFTDEELEQLVVFYESPVGRSLMLKTVELSGRSGAIGAEFQRQFLERMSDRLGDRQP